ncbi:MAG: hypothetical protein QXU18_03010 [Thermoplasmatales archaeon]
MNIDLDEYSWASIVSKILVLLGFVSLVFLVLFLLYKAKDKSSKSFTSDRLRERANNNTTSIESVCTKTSKGIHQKHKIWFFQYLHAKRRKIGLVFSFLILTILVLSIFGPIVTHDSIETSGGYYPFGFFTSEAVVGINSTYQFVNNYKSIEIYPTSPKYNYPPLSPLVFSRNATDEGLSMNISLDPLDANNTIFNSTFFNVADVSINLFNEISIPKDYSVLNPNITQNISYSDTSNYEHIPFLNFTGDSAIEYNFSISNIQKSGYYFLFEVSNNSNVTQQQVMYAKIGDTLVQFCGIPGSSSYILSQSVGSKLVIIHNYNLRNQLNFFGFGMDNGSLWVNIDNYGVYGINFNPDNSSHNMIFTIGKDFLYSASNYAYALEGRASPLFDFYGNITITHPKLLITIKKQNYSEYSIINSLNFTFSKSFDQYTIRSGNEKINWTSQDRIVSFGRLSYLSVPVIVSINDLKIFSEQPGLVLYAVALLTFILPGVCLSYLIYMKKGRSAL